MFKGGGVQKEGGLGVFPMRKGIYIFLIQVLEMAYFNWNDSTIWNIFIHFLWQQGGG